MRPLSEDHETILPVDEWRRLEASHRHRAEAWTRPARDRHASGRPHPVEDFLFTYYPFSFGKLEAWHPPFETALVAPNDPHPIFDRPPYRRVNDRCFADPSSLSEKARARLVWTRELLDQTSKRPALLSCHGLHEWAMVYRGREIRHATSTPLRLPQREIDAIVESRPIVCTHFDAFRFFHPEAQPMNRLQPELETRIEFEQPGCVHANMDLYKWASKAMPWVGSELLLATFELAIRLRELDMRASPYDLSDYGYVAIRIETAEGRRQYETLQKQFSIEAARLRQLLIEALDRFLR